MTRVFSLRNEAEDEFPGAETGATVRVLPRGSLLTLTSTFRCRKVTKRKVVNSAPEESSKAARTEACPFALGFAASPQEAAEAHPPDAAEAHPPSDDWDSLPSSDALDDKTVYSILKFALTKYTVRLYSADGSNLGNFNYSEGLVVKDLEDADGNLVEEELPSSEAEMWRALRAAARANALDTNDEGDENGYTFVRNGRTWTGPKTPH